MAKRHLLLQATTALSCQGKQLYVQNKSSGSNQDIADLYCILCKAADSQIKLLHTTGTMAQYCTPDVNPIGHHAIKPVKHGPTHAVHKQGTSSAQPGPPYWLAAVQASPHGITFVIDL